MAISVTWATKIINVPKADTTLIQSDPTEIRELDVNVLRLTLKDLEDDAEGMPFVDTHRHNTEVLLAGITYARVVEIINGYTLTFEDGQYAVNLFGANHNVGDVANVNQVSIRVNNSAGLISSPAIEFAAYEDGIVVDLTKTTSGTAFDLGTGANPVGNIPDALQIATNVGVKKLKIIGDITFSTGHDLTDFQIEGQSIIKTTITVDPDALVTGIEFEECTIQGTLDGVADIRRCRVLNLNFFEGFILDSQMAGTVVLGGSADSHIINCHDGASGGVSAEIDMGGSGRGLIVRNWWGGLELKNKTGPESIAIGAIGSKVTLQSTVGGTGQIFVRVTTGSFVNDGTATNIKTDITNPDTMADAVWDEPLTGSSHNTPTSAGRRLRQLEEVFIDASGTIVGITDGHTFLLDSGAVPTDDYYIGDRLQISEGTGAGQSRIVIAYSSSRVVVLDSDFVVNPDTNSLWELASADVHVSISDADLAEGFVVVANSLTQVTLDNTTAIAVDDYYNGDLIIFTHGTGAGQSREIIDYTSGRLVTFSPALEVAVGTDTVWHIQAAVSAAEIADEVWEESVVGHTTVGTFGGLVSTISTNVATLQILMTDMYGLQGANTSWSDIVETDNKITQYRVNRFADNTLIGAILDRWLYTATYSGDTITTLTRIVMFDLNPLLSDGIVLTDSDFIQLDRFLSDNIILTDNSIVT